MTTPSDVLRYLNGSEPVVLYRTIIARNVNWSLAAYLRNALRSPIATDRLGALDGLDHFHRIGNDVVRGRVRDEIQRLTNDDSRMVSAAAEQRLRSSFAQPPAQPIQQMPDVSKPEVDKVPESRVARVTEKPARQAGYSVPSAVSVTPSDSVFPTAGPLIHSAIERPERQQRIAMLAVIITVILLTSVGISSFIIFAPTAQNPAVIPTLSVDPTQTGEPAPPSESVISPSEGVTQISDITGPACSQIPTSGVGSGLGSGGGMVDDPVATAASNNPLLSTLVAAVTVTNLGDTLNFAEAITVFAPINSAFEKLPPGIVEQLTTALDVAEPTSLLSTILITHVVGTRYDAEGLSSADTVESLQAGSELTIGGTAPDALTVSSGGVTANVICGNMPTANATVFLIDTVLMPEEVSGGG
ncbi:MAG: fasciclin domain-containing protein [Pseudonocardiaceae bacterium]